MQLVCQWLVVIFLCYRFLDLNYKAARAMPNAWKLEERLGYMFGLPLFFILYFGVLYFAGAFSKIVEVSVSIP